MWGKKGSSSGYTPADRLEAPPIGRSCTWKTKSPISESWSFHVWERVSSDRKFWPGLCRGALQASRLLQIDGVAPTGLEHHRILGRGPDTSPCQAPSLHLGLCASKMCRLRPILPFLGSLMAMGQNPVPSVNIPIPTNIGSKMCGEFTNPKMGSHWS